MSKRARSELRLQHLTGLGRDDIAKAANEIADEIRQLLEILGSRVKIFDIVKTELGEVKDAFRCRATRQSAKAKARSTMKR